MMPRFWATPRPHILMQKCNSIPRPGIEPGPKMPLGKLVGHNFLSNAIYNIFQLVTTEW